MKAIQKIFEVLVVGWYYIFNVQYGDLPSIVIKISTLIFANLSIMSNIAALYMIYLNGNYKTYPDNLLEISIIGFLWMVCIMKVIFLLFDRNFPSKNSYGKGNRYRTYVYLHGFSSLLIVYLF